MSLLRDMINRMARRSSVICRMHVARSGSKLFSANPQWARHAEDWYGSRQDGRSSLSDRRPWLTYPAIEWLGEIDWHGKQVFEWGGGGSTLYFLDSGASVTTVEHDRAWTEHLRLVAAADEQQSMDLRLIEPTETTGLKQEQEFTSSKPQYRNASFEQYVKAIDDFPDQTFDLILIDGRCRSECLQRAIAKVRRQGALMFDNVDRVIYQEAIANARSNELSTWTQHDLSGPTPYLWDPKSTTLAWTRPAATA